MIVYVESNFILEVALVQDQHDACDELLRMAEARSIALVLPAFCIAEPYSTVGRRMLERGQLREQLSAQLRQLGRTRPYGEHARQSGAVVELLVRSNEEERGRLDQALQRTLSVSEIVHVDGALFGDAMQLRNSRGLVDTRRDRVC